ncbi:MAG TPA: AAA family ATPase, partial [Acidimicrobiales bacterium]|nr:AAA family ATPase [Acidimicrobiales bacterium]
VVVEAEYELEEHEHEDLHGISPSFSQCRYYRAVHLDNSVSERLVHAPPLPTIGRLKEPLRAIAAHVDERTGSSRSSTAHSARSQSEGPPPNRPATAALEEGLKPLHDGHQLSVAEAATLSEWLENTVAPHVEPANELEMSRLAALREAIGTVSDFRRVVEEFRRRLPVMVYVSTYPSVTPLIHLGHLADAIDAEAVDPNDEYYFGNLCLLRMLNFSARELSDLGKASEPAAGDLEAFERYRRQLDERDAALNAASLQLTTNIKSVWDPAADDEVGPGRYAIRVTADQQYLKVTVEDSLGVQIELDQRSQGFRWLVSFFVIFCAQAFGRTDQAILLLDEPGLSLHGLKQRQFRHTLSRLGAANQVLFSTHSPFLVGPEELDRVRVVELVDRAEGTKVRSGLAARDPASVLPLQEALVYDLARSLFPSGKTLILESLTDYWYLAATAELLKSSGTAALDADIELVPVSSLARMVYFSTLLHGNGVKLAALLDSDAAGREAAAQDQLVELLGDKQVLRTKDSYSGPVVFPRIEDLLRDTLITVASELGWRVTDDDGTAEKSVDQLFADAVGPEYSPYRLAKGYVRWARDHLSTDLSADERIAWLRFIDTVNQALV